MPVMHVSVDARDDATAAFGRTVASRLCWVLMG